AAFVAACRAYQDELARARARLRRRIMTGLVAGLVVTAGLAAVAAWAWRRAVAEEREATSLAGRVKYRYVRLSVDNGRRLLEQGDVLGALLWSANALLNDAEDAAVHRARVATILQQYPGLIQLFPHDREVETAAVSPDGRLVATCAG